MKSEKEIRERLKGFEEDVQTRVVYLNQNGWNSTDQTSMAIISELKWVLEEKEIP